MLNSPTNQAIFFGSTQSVLINSAILAICKLYENSDPQRNQTHSMHHIILKLRNTQAVNQIETVVDECRFLFGDDGEIPCSTDDLLQKLTDIIPKRDTYPPLEKAFKARDKTIAHQERLSQSLQEELAWLPTEEELLHLCKWAECASQALLKLYWGARMISSAQSLEVATNNVVLKVLSHQNENG